MNKLRGMLAVSGAATVISGATWGVASAPHSTHAAAYSAAPDSIIGDITLTAAATNCSYTDWTGHKAGPGGGVTVDMTYMSGCGQWQVKVECQNNNGSYVWRYSRAIYGSGALTAACYSDQYAVTGGWTGFWNSRYHQVF